MADQNITELPIKTNSGVASTDYMLGIDSAEGYQILVRDVAKYIVENYNGSAIAGPQQSIQAAFQNCTYLLRSGTTIHSQADLNNYYNVGNYYCGANAVVTSLSNCPVSKAFIMKVEWSSGNGNPRQIIYVYDTYECYIRWTSKLDGTGWSEWVKQPTRAEITELNSNIYTEINTGIASSYGTLQYKCYKTGHIVGFAGQLILTSDCPAATDIITGLPTLGSFITNYPPVRMFNNTASQFVDMNLRRVSSATTSPLSIYNRSALSSGASLRFNFTYCCE